MYFFPQKLTNKIYSYCLRQVENRIRSGHRADYLQQTNKVIIEHKISSMLQYDGKCLLQYNTMGWIFEIMSVLDVWWSFMTIVVGLYFDSYSRMSVSQQHKKSAIIEVLFFNRKIDQLKDQLERNPEIDLLTLTDSQNNTVLHQLAYEGHLDIIQLFVKNVRKRATNAHPHTQIFPKLLKQSQIKQWMDTQNDEGFTPLLYASYSGHLEVIKYLVEEHLVNFQLTTRSGLNPLHLSAQKNMVLPFIYFRQKIDINAADSLNSTPLQWAAYTNSEQVIAFLLAQPNLNCLDHRDNEGNTALMLAVLYGNSRIVRRLLIKGADRSIPNNQNKVPLQIANQNKFNTIIRMLKEDLNCLDHLKLYSNVKIQYRPQHRSLKYPIILLLTFTLNVAILNYIINFNEPYLLYSQVAVFAITILLYLTLLKGPPPSKPKPYAQLTKGRSQKDMKKLCFECRNVPPLRGYHCDVCKVCVQQYDHHCTWINNCVGKGNISRFKFFLFFLILSLAFVGLFSVLAEITIFTNYTTQYSQWFELRYPIEETLYREIQRAGLAICVVSSLFIIPVSMLLIHQLKNLLKKKEDLRISGLVAAGGVEGERVGDDEKQGSDKFKEVQGYMQRQSFSDHFRQQQQQGQQQQVFGQQPQQQQQGHQQPLLSSLVPS